jgi:phenylacetic acid degradation operon negative regulatory protein
LQGADKILLKVVDGECSTLLSTKQAALPKAAVPIAIRSTPVSRWIESRRLIVQNNTGGIIIALFGDSIVPHGGIVRLGSVVTMAKSLGISESAARSAVARLANDGVLESAQVGRRSDYRLPHTEHSLTSSFYRIYLPQHDEWNGQFEFVLLHQNRFSPATLLEASESLCCDGFYKVSDVVFVRPVINHSPLTTPLKLLSPSFSSAFSCFYGDISPNASGGTVYGLLESILDFSMLDASYADFVTCHEPLLEELWNNRNITPEEAFIVRTYLIYDYQRIVMKAPLLPANLKPPSPAIVKGKYVVRELYDLLVEKSEAYLGTVLETSDGRYPPLERAFFERFDGLTRLND